MENNIGYILCKVHVWKWPVVKYWRLLTFLLCQNKAKNLCTIYFVFDFDDECKFIKNKT